MLAKIANRWLRAFAGLLVGAAAVATVAGDETPDSGPTQGQDNSGVYVRDSAIAMERLALAQRMARMKEWGKSADLYQEILTLYPDRVVATADVASSGTAQYTAVTQAVCQAICKWPPEGLDVYRSRYETPAANLLIKAGAAGAGQDLGTLRQVYSVYFPTNSGKAAGIRMMDAYFELGDYAAAAQIGRRLLDWHPNLMAERPMTLYRTAIAEKLCGDAVSAQRHDEELRKRFPQAVGTIGGVDTVLADSLEKELAAGGLSVRTVSDSWMTVGGDESRSKLSNSVVKPGARLYSIALSKISRADVPDANTRKSLEQQDAAERQSGADLGVMPVVDRGELYFQDNLRLYAVNLDSGLPLPGWAETWRDQDGSYRLPGSAEPMPPGQQFCVTLNDKCAVAVMGLADGQMNVAEIAPVGQTRLVCLDRRSGRELWTASVGQLPEKQEALRRLQLSGAPLIVGDNVYVVGHGGQGMALEDCYVLCFSLADGQFRWATYVASSNSDQPRINPNDGMPMFPAVASHLAYASGRLFVLSNLGAVASLDAYSGAVVWLNIYRSGMAQPAWPLERGMMGGGTPEITGAAPPWKYNPPIVLNGKVFVLPSDGQYVYVYDADSGAELKKIWLTDLPPDDGDINQPDTLLGVDDEMMYLGGPSRVWRLPWQKYDHATDHQPSGYWASVSTGSDTRLVRGRAFVTADAIYLPMASAILRMVLKNGMIDSKEGTFPRNGWEEGQEGPGNVLATQDYLIVAGDEHVTVYTDVALARARLDREIAAAPSEPLPRLHYAEVMFAAGQNALAEDKFEEVFQLLGGVHNLRGGAVRDRAFQDVLNFAVRLSKKPDQVATAQRLFDLAKAAAQSPSQQIAYRMALAKFDLLNNDLPSAIAMYQEILSDAAMRSSPQADPDTSTASHAGRVAEKAIAHILSLPDGRAAYDKFEQAAAAALAAANGAADPEQMLAVAEVYPNAQKSRQALMAAADAFESLGNPRRAVLALRQLLGQTQGSERAIVLESLARNYLKMPGRLEVAATRLAMAAMAAAPDAKLAKALVLPDGSVLRDMTLGAARDRLNSFVAQASADALPDLHLPTAEQCLAYHLANSPFLKESPNQLIDNVNALVVPLGGFARNDRIISWSAPGGLAVYSVGKNVANFTCAAVKDPPQGAAWMDGALVVWNYDSAFLIDPENGTLRAQIDPANIEDLNVTGDPAAPAGPTAAPAGGAEQINAGAPVGDRAVFATSGGRIFAVDAADGHVVWQTRVGFHGVDQLLANDDFTVVQYSEAGTMQLIVLNSLNGELVGRKSFARDAGTLPLKFALSADGTLAYTLADRLCVLDLNEITGEEGGMEPKFSDSATPEGVAIFPEGGGPDQLIVHNRLAFALADEGRNVRVYSLDTGKPWPQPDGDGDTILPTKSDGNPNVTLHISGNYVYLLSPSHLTAYALDHPSLSWDSPAPQWRNDFDHLLFGKDYLLVVDLLAPRPAEYTRRKLKLLGYSRAPVKSRPQEESGICRYELSVDPDAVTWQAVEGGVVYFSGNAIHTLLGARDSLGAKAAVQ